MWRHSPHFLMHFPLKQEFAKRYSNKPLHEVSKHATMKLSNHFVFAVKPVFIFILYMKEIVNFEITNIAILATFFFEEEIWQIWTTKRELGITDKTSGTWKKMSSTRLPQSTIFYIIIKIYIYFPRKKETTFLLS